MFLQTIKRLVRRSPKLTRTLGAVYGLVAGPFPGSQDYWVKRYAKGGNSGPGSYSELAKFKASVLNAFVREHGIQSVIEFGCGDGNQECIDASHHRKSHRIDNGEKKQAQRTPTNQNGGEVMPRDSDGMK